MSRPSPLRRSVILFFLLSLFSKNLAAQSAQADSAQAGYWLNRAQAQLDSSQPQLALLSARKAESLLTARYDSADLRLSDVNCMVGICLLKTDPNAAEPYFNRVSAYGPLSSPLSQAQVLFFQAQVYQLLGMRQDALNTYGACQKWYEQAASGHLPHVNLARVYNNMGVVLSEMGQHEAALVQLRKALDLWQKIHGPVHPNVAHAYHNEGLVYLRQGRADEAEAATEKGLEIRLRTLGPEPHRELAASYLNTGWAYIQQDRLGLAVDALQQAIEMARQTGSPVVEDYALTNLGLVYSRRGRQEQARAYFFQAKQMEEVLFGAGSDELATTNFSIAATYEYQQNFDSAFFYYHLALSMATPEHAEMGNFLNGMGLAYLQWARYDSAETYFLRAKKISAERPYLDANIDYNLSNLYAVQGRMNEAFDWNRRGQERLGYRGDQQFTAVPDLGTLSQLLTQESNLQLQKNQAFPSAADLSDAQRAANQAATAFDLLLNRCRETSTQQDLILVNYQLFEKNIALNEQMFRADGRQQHVEEAFRLSERSKDFALLKAVKDSEAVRFAGVPESILEQEHDLQLRLAWQDKRYTSAQLDSGLTDEHPRLIELSQQRKATRDSLDQLIHGLERAYPAYFDLKYRLNPVTIPQIQAGLADDQSLIEYFMGDDSLFIFLIQRNRPPLLLSYPGTAIGLWIDSLTKDGIRDFGSADAFERARKTQAFTEAAMWLYDRLLRPLEDRLTPRLIIVTDGPLGYVPFDALLTNHPPLGIWGEYRFALEKYSIAYSYSATLWQEMSNKIHTHTPSIGFLGFAPFAGPDSMLSVGPMNTSILTRAFGQDTLYGLPRSGQEVRNAQKHWGGKVFLQPEATLANWQREAPDARILQLSTHGKADERSGDRTWLAFAAPDPFSFEYQYARDLYALNINADLVILSACESGGGEFRRGESIVGYARGFAYAGAKSIAASLWSIQDAPTTDIVDRLHFYLDDKKMPKDKALQEAKLDYLRRPKDIGYQMHPYYWAGLIMIGDLAPISRN